MACASVVSNVGDRAVECLQRLEDDGVHVNAGLLRRCFEGLSVPQDQREAFRRLQVKEGKTTGAAFAEICTHLKTDRMWTWLLLHPDMPEDRVHPSRRMLSSCIPSLCLLMALRFLKVVVVDSLHRTMGVAFNVKGVGVLKHVF